MHIKLFTKIKANATVICGFPTFGLLGAITTEFLIEHLNAFEVGVIHYEEVYPTIAVHRGKIIKPIAIYYDKKNNIVLFHVILGTKGIEWKLADTIASFAKSIKAKEIINIEGVPKLDTSNKINAYYLGNHKFADLDVKQLQESVLVGVVAGLFLRIKKNISSLFIESKSNLPDSKGAAKAIEIIDKYLNLHVDYKPLLKQAELFEQKLKSIVEQGNKVMKTIKNKDMSYVG